VSRYPRTVLGTVCLPWRADGELDEALFRRSIRNLVAAGLPDLYVFGTAGEGYAVSDAMFRRVATIFTETMREAGGARPMIGIVSLSLATMIERIEFCRTLGVDTFQFALPGWAPTSNTEMRRVFAEICDRFGDCRFLHYNLMRAGRLVRPRDYAELAERHPNLVATKYGGGDPFMISGLMTHAPQLRHFLTEQGYYLGAPLGDCALLASISSSNPRRAREYLETGRNGEVARFRELYRELCGVLHALLDTAGTGLIDGAYDKVILKLSEPDFPLALLPPYETASEEVYGRYRDILAERYPAWLPATR
jgi:dihydrodipicolinate synthase/N-acetylneuraminate lyase